MPEPDELDPEKEVAEAIRRATPGQSVEVSAGLLDGSPWHSVSGVLRSKKARIKGEGGTIFWHLEAGLMHHYIAVQLIRQVSVVRRQVW